MLQTKHDLLACPNHQEAIVNRYHTGLGLQQKLTASLDTIQ